MTEHGSGNSQGIKEFQGNKLMKNANNASRSSVLMMRYAKTSPTEIPNGGRCGDAYHERLDLSLAHAWTTCWKRPGC